MNGATAGGVLISKMALHDQNEPPPGSTSSDELLSKARNTPREMSDKDWKHLLSSVQYQVARRHGTERAWTGRYNEEKRKGVKMV